MKLIIAVLIFCVLFFLAYKALIEQKELSIDLSPTHPAYEGVEFKVNRIVYNDNSYKYVPMVKENWRVNKGWRILEKTYLGRFDSVEFREEYFHGRVFEKHTQALSLINEYKAYLYEQWKNKPKQVDEIEISE